MPTSSSDILPYGRALLLDQNQSSFVRSNPFVVTLNNFSLSVRSPCRRRIFQVSALSAFDCRLCAYNGYNG